MAILTTAYSGISYNYTYTDGTTSTGWVTGTQVNQWNDAGIDYSFIPQGVRDVVEPIMGRPARAKFIISYAYKKDKDPVIFIKNRKQLIDELKRLMADERVDKRTILVSEIGRQFKPTRKLHREALKLKN